MGVVSKNLERAVARSELVPVIFDVEADFLSRVSGVLNRIGTNVRSIPRFSMVSALVSSRDVLQLADVTGVKRVFLDKPVSIPETPFADGFPVVALGGFAAALTLRLKGAKRAVDKAHTTVATGRILGADVAHKEGITGVGVKVAVIDTDSSLRYRRHPQNGFFRVQGISVHGGVVSSDTNGHGGHVTTTSIGGETRFGDFTFKGIAPNAEGIGVKVLFTPIGTGTDSDVIKGLELAVENGAKIFNMSLGGPPSKNMSEDALCTAMERLPRDVIVVAASGNESASEVGSPAYCPRVISVGAFDPATGEVAEFSNKGTALITIAPGVDVFSGITPGTLLDALGRGLPDYSVLSGTSMATPHITGMLALMAQLYQQKGVPLTSEEVVAMLQSQGETRSVERGYGPITWPMIKEFMAERIAAE